MLCRVLKTTTKQCAGSTAVLCPDHYHFHRLYCVYLTSMRHGKAPCVSVALFQQYPVVIHLTHSYCTSEQPCADLNLLGGVKQLKAESLTHGCFWEVGDKKKMEM